MSPSGIPADVAVILEVRQSVVSGSSRSHTGVSHALELYLYLQLGDKVY